MRPARLKPFLFIAGCAPAAYLVWRAFHDGLGANPVEAVTHATGDWALRFLLITLLISPARKSLGMPELIKFRRMLGLFAFFYATLHFLTWFVLDKSVNVTEMLKDFSKRPFIAAGATAFFTMLPLAITSTTGWIRRLGGKRWQRLHRLIYLSCAAAVVHYYWLVKSDIRLPVLYGVLYAILMLWRIALNRKGRVPERVPVAR